jgi:thioredoxin-related protein
MFGIDLNVTDALCELVDNSLQATSNLGDQFERKIQLTIKRTGETKTVTEVRVRDNGIGLSKEEVVVSTRSLMHIFRLPLTSAPTALFFSFSENVQNRNHNE